MSRRIVIEEPCEHGFSFPHHAPVRLAGGVAGIPGFDCPGGSRTVLEGIPDEWVQRGVEAHYQYQLDEAMTTDEFVARLFDAAVFGEIP